MLSPTGTELLFLLKSLMQQSPDCCYRIAPASKSLIQVGKREAHWTPEVGV